MDWVELAQDREVAGTCKYGNERYMIYIISQ